MESRYGGPFFLHQVRASLARSFGLLRMPPVLVFQPQEQPEQHDAGKSIQLGKAEAGSASVDGDFDAFGNLAHKCSLCYIGMDNFQVNKTNR